jgi:hypothetical protein
MSEYETINVKFAKDGEDIKLVSIDDNTTSSIPANAPSLGKFADGTFNKNADDVKIEEAIKATKEQPSTEVVQNENSTPVSSQSQFENNKQPENPVVQNQREEKKMSMMDELKAKLNARNEAAATGNKADQTTEPGNDEEEEGENFTNVPDYSETKDKWNQFLQGKIEKERNVKKQTKLTDIKREINATQDTEGLKNTIKKYIGKYVITDKYKLADDFSPPDEDKVFLLGGRKTVRNMKYKLKRTQNKRSNKRRTKKHHK